MIKNIIFYCLLGASLQAQYGCSTYGKLKYDKAFSHFSYVNPNAPKGGAIRLGWLGGFSSFNPFVIQGSAPYGMTKCYATLLQEAADDPGASYAYVAEHVQVSEDFKEVTFTLNPNACFSDGTPITPLDVIFSFNILKEEGNPIYGQYYKKVERVEQRGDHTVVFLCPKNKSREIGMILGQLPILSHKFYENHSFTTNLLDIPPLSGPYKIKEYQPSRYVVYERIKGWWAESIPSQKGKHNFDEIRVDFYRENTSFFEAFKKGDIDLRLENSAKLLKTSYDFREVQEGLVQRIDFPLSGSSGTYGFFLNTRHVLLKDRRVRRALNLLFDFEWLNHTIFYDTYTRNTSYFQNLPFAAPSIMAEEEKKILKTLNSPYDEALLQTQIFSNNDSLKDKDRLTREALSLLQDAGCTLSQGKLNYQGKPVVWEILSYDASLSRIMLHLQACFKKVGIELKIRSLDASSYEQAVQDLKYDLVLGIFGQSSTPGNEQRMFFSSASAHQKGTFNYAGIQDPLIDELIDRVVGCPSYQELIPHMQLLDRILRFGDYCILAWHSAKRPIFFWNKFDVPEIKEPLFSAIDLELWDYMWWNSEKSEALEKIRGVTQAHSQGFFEKMLSWIQKLFE